MKIKLQELVNGWEPLLELSQHEIPISTAYLIAKNIRNIRNEVEPFFEIRNKTLAPYMQEQSGTLRIPAEDVDTVNEALSSVLNDVVEVELFTFPVESLGELSVKPSILEKVWFMFIER